MSINSGSGSIAEARIEKGLPFRIKGKMTLIGDEERLSYIYLNMDEVTEARFVKARSSDGRQSYTIQFSILRVIVKCALISPNYMIVRII